MVMVRVGLRYFWSMFNNPIHTIHCFISLFYKYFIIYVMLNLGDFEWKSQLTETVNFFEL